MKAIRIHKHGKEDVLQIDDIPEPEPQAGEVKIKIKASSLNHMDLWVRDGIPGIAPLPLILGCDGSGDVVACGAGVRHVAIDERVFIHPVLSCGECAACKQGLENHCRYMQLFGEHVNGTHCEYICVPEKNVLKLDESISFEDAAAFPLVFLTAWHMLVYNGKVKKGSRVLVMGGSSGVGSAAIQIAKHHGAFVMTTVGSDEKKQLAVELGADAVIDHYNESISKRVKELTEKQGADIIVEHVGEKVWAECLKALGMSGRLITCGATTGPMISMDLRHLFIKQQQLIGSTMGNLNELRELHALMASKTLKPLVGKVFPYTQVQEAHQYLADSKHFGKVVLNW